MINGSQQNIKAPVSFCLAHKYGIMLSRNRLSYAFGSLLTMIRNVLTKMLGDPSHKTIKSLTPLVTEVNSLEAEMVQRSDDALRD